MNHTKILTQSTTVSNILYKEYIAEAYSDACEMDEKRLLTELGILNAYTWRAAVDYDAIARRPDEVYQLQLDNWNKLLLDSVNGNLSIFVALEWMQGYLKEHWKGAYNSENSLRKYRKEMLERGLFHFDIENRPKGAYWGSIRGIPMQGVATPPILEKVNLVKILIRYQVFDQVRRERINQKLHDSERISAFECMPDHGGMLMVNLYNALFHGIRDFFGNYYSDRAIEINCKEDIEVPKKEYLWKWKLWRSPSGLCRKFWENLVNRANFKMVKRLNLGDFMRGCVDAIAPLGDLSEVPY